MISMAKASKTPDELSAMREGLRITEQAIADVQAKIAPGVRQTDLTATFLRDDLRGRRRRQHPRPDLAGHAGAHGGRSLDHDGRPRLPAAVDRARAGRGRRAVGRPRHQLRRVPLRLRPDLGGGREPSARQRAQYEQWQSIMGAVLDVTRAGATAADLTAAAIGAAGGIKPWMPHFYLGHGLGIDSAEMPYVGSDIGEAFDASLVLVDGMVLVLEPIVWDDGAAGYRSEEVLRITRGRLGAHDRLLLRPLLEDPMTVVETLPDDAALRRARRARVLAAMEEADVDFLVVGREGNARYVSGAPRLWTAGSRAFGPGCVFVRETGAVHLLSTWDEGIPEEIPHENLYGITFNAMNFVTVLSKIAGAATAKRVATDSMSGSSANLLPKAFPAAEFIDGEPMLRRVRRVKSPEEVEAIRASVRVAEEALAAATKALVPGVTERQLTAIFMEAMAAAGVTTPSGQDVAWITSPPGIRGGAPTAIRRCNPETWWPSRPASSSGATRGRWAAPTRCARGSRRLRAGPAHQCPVGAPPRRLPGRGAADRPPRRLRRRRRARSRPCRWPAGSGLGFDLPLVTHALPADGRRAARRGGHGVRADRLRLEGGRRRALRAGADRRHRLRARVAVDDAHSANKEPDDVSAADVPPAEEIILYEKDPATRIATITLNRPDQLNIPTIAARRRYADLIFKANIDDDVKVLVVRGIGDHLGTGADLDELMAKREAGTALHEEFGIDEDEDVTMPGPRSYRAGASLLHWYGNPQVGLPHAAGLQEDQHPGGQGLLLRLALLPGGRRRPRHLVRRRAVRPSRLPLRRLRAAHVAVGDDDGAAQVPGDGVHRPAVHGRADVRVQLREQRRPAGGPRGGDGQVRLRLLADAARPTRCSCRRSSSR